MTEIPPEKTRKFLRAAVIGMVQQGIPLDQAREAFVSRYCATAAKLCGNQTLGAEKIDTSTTTMSIWVRKYKKTECS